MSKKQSPKTNSLAQKKAELKRVRVKDYKRELTRVANWTVTKSSIPTDQNTIPKKKKKKTNNKYPTLFFSSFYINIYICEFKVPRKKKTRNRVGVEKRKLFFFFALGFHLFFFLFFSFFFFFFFFLFSHKQQSQEASVLDALYLAVF